MMTNGWQTVQLGDVLKRVKSELTIDDSVTYKQVTVRLWNKGVVLRGEQEGVAIKTKRQFYVKTGQLLLSRIDVRNGAIGLVPNELDGAIVSNDFWVYDFDENQIYPEFLALYVKTPTFIEDANRTSSGTTKRIRAEETAFLNITIPLPPLTEQRRIVAHIESLSARVNEAQHLREGAMWQTEKFLTPIEMQIWSDKSLVDALALADITLYLARGRQSRQGPSSHYLIKTQHVQMGYYVPSKRTLSPEVASKVLPEAHVKYNDILIACSAAGCLGRVAYYKEEGKTASTDTHIAIARANPEVVLPEYLFAYLKSAQGQFQLRSRERGDWKREKIGFRLTELNLSELQRVPVPVPPLDEQRRIVAYLDGLQAKVNALRKLQSASGEELSALMPSILDKAFKGEL